ncbi:MAG: hypothetical protein WCH39_15730 [Schlesneria sp.]
MFAYELALELGHVDVDKMLESITPIQFEEWRIFGRLRPFGDRRADLRNAMLAIAIDAVVAHAVGGDPCLEPESLMPFDKPDSETDEDREERGWEDPELQMAKLELLAQQWCAK